jgi:hypothetical protein
MLGEDMLRETIASWQESRVIKDLRVTVSGVSKDAGSTSIELEWIDVAAALLVVDNVRHFVQLTIDIPPRHSRLSIDQTLENQCRESWLMKRMS